MSRKLIAADGNEAAAHVAYRVSEVIAIYPITPSTPMAESCDQYAAFGMENIWGQVPRVMQMQSEGGVAGAIHGALQTGSLCTTFTASQGLLLMIPNMYKIAGELTPCVWHIAARSLATHALSIFGDHSDVMAVRQTGWAQLFSSCVQECMDLALVAHAATLKTRIPFVHAFDGFRTSHEIQKIEQLGDDDIAAMIDDEAVRDHRARAMNPDAPNVRGTAQNPDTFFQAREACNSYYAAAPDMVQQEMDQLARLTGRQYHLFDYFGVEDAERVIVIMGSGAETACETEAALNASGEKVGVLVVRLFRPFSVEHFLDAIPSSVKSIAVLDRTKEPGSIGEPLYQDVVTAFSESTAASPRIIGGRYGLSSKEFTPAMVKAVFDELLATEPKNHFTIGINDDVTHTSLSYDPSFRGRNSDTTSAVFWGLGADGTVGANKNSIKIIANGTDLNAQGYFVYDSRKSGSQTVSHLRFGKDPIRAPYLVRNADFVAVHQFSFFEKYDCLATASQGATVLINSNYGPDRTWEHLPVHVQEQFVTRGLRLFVIDAYKIARETHMGARINTIMQTCFFQLAGVLPPEEAIKMIKEAIQKTYGKRGDAIVKMNYAAVDASLANLHEVRFPDVVSSKSPLLPLIPEDASDFIKNVTARLLANEGDLLPVSAFPPDGTFPSGTTRYEKRNIALQVPVWEEDLCIQCGKCVIVCPHGVIRGKVCEPHELENAPPTFKTADAKWREMPGKRFSLQVAVEDCTGCTLCVDACPAKDRSNVGRKAINMADQLPIREQERENWDFFTKLPDFSPADAETAGLKLKAPKDIQLLTPYLEFSGACTGCGETPYLKLMSQLTGDHTYIANATGCSSIYGGNLPTTPWCTDKHGRGPAWSNSLFEDNAEFGLGMRLTIDQQSTYARDLVKELAPEIGDQLAASLLDADQATAAGIEQQRERIAALHDKLANSSHPRSRELLSVSGFLAKKTVWICGGDGWAYDIGYGGLDHVMATGANVNILVMDTEVYSNTGGQSSKATPLGAVAKFAAGGKPTVKKNMGLLAMDYGHVYIAQVAMGSSDMQTLKAFQEAESYDGPSLILAYSHCIAHGIDITKGLVQQSLAVQSGHWLLYRYDPRRTAEGLNPLQLDSKAPKIPLKEYHDKENRFRMLTKSSPDVAQHYLKQAQETVNRRFEHFKQLADS
ncbi:pyruvate:ferredoxin (flavodoxin) oxidoreductase [Haloferula sp.]|uniref:pyruvate:ferredoxin (flavodoxin) oxidoreductase n=1 Tax=Haloferula sp. TaxID=2497595 RepID=UPI003C729E02